MDIDEAIEKLLVEVTTSKADDALQYAEAVLLLTKARAVIAEVVHKEKFP